jgi:diguanylate cyclase (GGDEF)-like protein/PAS domain S-box-containing protein
VERETQQENELYRNIVENLFDGVYTIDRQHRITYWNKGAEDLVGYGRSEVIGKPCRESLTRINGDGFLICGSDSCLSMRAMEDKQQVEAEVYLLHKEGYRVPVLTRINPIYGENGQVTGAMGIFRNNAALLHAREEIKELQGLAMFDSLTGLGNRRFGQLALRAKLAEARRFGRHFGVLFADVDRFKQINDDHGHDTGDEALRTIGLALKSGLREVDALVRWGGEEFLGLISNCDPDGLVVIGERLRRLVEQSAVTSDLCKIRLTLSVGATLANSDDDETSLIRRADRLLYEAKRLGRNRLVCDPIA